MRSKVTCTAETFTGELIGLLIAQLDLSVLVLLGGREGLAETLRAQPGPKATSRVCTPEHGRMQGVLTWWSSTRSTRHRARDRAALRRRRRDRRDADAGDRRAAPARRHPPTPCPHHRRGGRGRGPITAAARPQSSPTRCCATAAARCRPPSWCSGTRTPTMALRSARRGSAQAGSRRSCSRRPPRAGYRRPPSISALSLRSDASASLAGRPPTSAWLATAPSGPSGALNSLR